MGEGSWKDQGCKIATLLVFHVHGLRALWTAYLCSDPCKEVVQKFLWAAMFPVKVSSGAMGPVDLWSAAPAPRKYDIGPRVRLPQRSPKTAPANAGAASAS